MEEKSYEEWLKEETDKDDDDGELIEKMKKQAESLQHKKFMTLRGKALIKNDDKRYLEVLNNRPIKVRFDQTDAWRTLPHNLFKAMRLIGLSGLERDVLDYIVDNTIGYHNEKKPIDERDETEYFQSPMNIGLQIGVDRSQVSKVLKKLRERNIIFYKEFKITAGKMIFRYILNVYFEHWIPRPNREHSYKHFLHYEKQNQTKRMKEIEKTKKTREQKRSLRKRK